MTNLARPKTERTKTPAKSMISSEAIAARAFALYTARGGEHGHDVDDWLRAEQELRAAPEAPKRRPGRKLAAADRNAP
jgi:Protein of unknown function (DUF2934)